MEIMKVFSSFDDYGYEDERLYSVLMDEYELALFSDKNKKKKLRTGDKIGIWTKKHLNTKKDREAVIEGLKDGNWHNYAKQSAKYGALGGALGGAAAGYVVKGGAKGAAKLAALGALGGGAAGYLGARLGGGIRNIGAKHSTSMAEENERVLDRALVANGDMSEEEYIKKHVK